MFLAAQVQQNVPLLAYIIIVFPVLLFAPGFILTKVFMRDTDRYSFSELWYLRIVMSVAVNSINALILILGHTFSLFYVCFWNVLVTLGMCFVVRFRFPKRKGISVIDWRDFFVVGLIFLVAGFSFTPSEHIQEAYLHGMTIFRGQDFQWWDLDGNGPFAAIWHAIFIAMFGPRIALLTSPFFAILSVAGTYFCARRLFAKDVGAIIAALLQAMLFTQIWFSRTSDAMIITQFLYVICVYLLILFSQNKQKCTLVFFLIYAALFSMGAQQNWIFTLLMSMPFFVRYIAFRKLEKTNVPFVRFSLVVIFMMMMYVILLHYNQWTQMINVFYWVLAACGLLIVVSHLRTYRIKTEGLVLLGFALCTLYALWNAPLQVPFMKKAAVVVPVVIPSVCIYCGFVWTRILSKSKYIKALLFVFVGIAIVYELYMHWPLLWVRDHSGILQFYQRFTKVIQPNDVLISNKPHFCAIMTKIYGVKCYRVDQPEYFDQSFKSELKEWIEGGGRVLLITDMQASDFDGVGLKLMNVESIQTYTIESAQQIPRKGNLESKKFYLYQVISL